MKTLHEVKDLIWQLHEAYDSGDDDFPAWGDFATYVQGDTKGLEHLRNAARDLFAGMLDVDPHAADRVLNRSYGWHEHSLQSARDLGEAVDELAEWLHPLQGRRVDAERASILDGQLRTILADFPADTYFLMSHRPTSAAGVILRKASETTGVPPEELRGAFHMLKVMQEKPGDKYFSHWEESFAEDLRIASLYPAP